MQIRTIRYSSRSFVTAMLLRTCLDRKNTGERRMPVDLALARGNRTERLTGRHADRRLAHAPRLAYAIVTMALMVACGGSTASNPAPSPTAPTPTPPAAVTVTTVTVTTASATASVVQLVATARSSDGTTLDVTSAAQWESSNTSLATVVPGGLVTVVGTGDVDLRATYQSVTGTMRLIVSLPPRTNIVLSGVAREVAP